MQINDRLRKERIAKMLGENEARSVINATIRTPKSIAQISEELGLPSRTAYRHVSDLCEVGLLAGTGMFSSKVAENTSSTEA